MKMRQRKKEDESERQTTIDVENNQRRNNIYIIGVLRHKNKKWNRTNIYNY